MSETETVLDPPFQGIGNREINNIEISLFVNLQVRNYQC